MIRGSVIRRTVLWGNCLSGNCTSGKYLRKTARLGELRREKVRRGTVKIPIDPGTVRIPT